MPRSEMVRTGISGSFTSDKICMICSLSIIVFIYFQSSTLTRRSLDTIFEETAFLRVKIQDVLNEHHFCPTKYAGFSFQWKGREVLTFQMSCLSADTIHLSILQAKFRFRMIRLRN